MSILRSRQAEPSSVIVVAACLSFSGRLQRCDIGLCDRRYDAQDVLIKLQDEHEQGANVGIDISTGEAIDPQVAGIYDNYLVKRQIILSAPVIASQLLLVDEVMRAGINMRQK